MSNEARQGKAAADAAAEEARKAGETVREETRQLADEAGKTGREEAEKQFERGQSVAASQVETLSSAVDDAARSLNEQDHPLAQYTRELADSMSGLSDRISNSSLDELASDTRRIARENPALFLLGGIAVGFAASRFFKASAARGDDNAVHGQQNDYSAHNDRGYRTAGAALPDTRTSVTPTTPATPPGSATSAGTPVSDAPATPAVTPARKSVTAEEV